MRIQKTENQKFCSSSDINKDLLKRVGDKLNIQNGQYLVSVVKDLSKDGNESRHFIFDYSFVDEKGQNFLSSERWLFQLRDRLTIQATEKFEHLGQTLTASTRRIKTPVPIKYLSEGKTIIDDVTQKVVPQELEKSKNKLKDRVNRQEAAKDRELVNNTQKSLNQYRGSRNRIYTYWNEFIEFLQDCLEPCKKK